MFNYLVLFSIIGLAALSVSESPSLTVLTGIPAIFGGLLATKLLLIRELRRREELHTKALSIRETTVLLLNDFETKTMGSEFLFPPVLLNISPKDLTEKLFDTYFLSFKNDHSDLVFRVLSVFNKTLLPWNLQTVASAISNPKRFFQLMSHNFDDSEKLFFEAVTDGIVDINAQFVSEFEQVAAKLWFLYSDIRLGIPAEGNYLIPNSSWRQVDELFVSHFIPARIIQPTELLDYLDYGLLTPKIPKIVLFN